MDRDDVACFLSLKNMLGGIVKLACTILGPVFLLAACLQPVARAEAQDSCKSYRIDFNDNFSGDTFAVTANGKAIGKVQPPKGGPSQSRQITVCIEQKYANIFDTNSFAYVFDRSIGIYNLWPSPTKIQDNGSIKGFTSLIDALTHVAKIIPQIVEGMIRDFFSKLFEAVFGTKVGSETKPPQHV